VLGLDHYAPFLLSAFGITLVVLVVYVLYLRSRLGAVRRQRGSYSARNVNAAAARVTNAQAARSANGPSTP
jgi:heme exporter protein D